MGAHKHNPTAIAAKAGKLPPKKKTASYAETVRLLRGPLAAEMATLSPESIRVLENSEKKY